MAYQLDPSEYNPYYAHYLEKVEVSDLLSSLEEGLTNTSSFFESIPKEKLDFRYAPGKWSPKEILQHIIDTERVFAYRALHFARADKVVLPGFDQDEFASNINADRKIEDLLDEYKIVRSSSIAFVKSCDEIAMQRRGVASESPISVRAAFHIICGHEVHHMEIIRERYL
ncbi:MAG: DinB family protein [Bacteroidia bacterium]|nr:DinB family protein [Bacteroidia bacterium]